jgi:diguanylate cyclase
MESGVALVLGTQCVLLVLIGWVVYRANPALFRRQSNSPLTTGGSSADAGRAQELLSEVGYALTEHGEQIGVFQEALDRQPIPRDGQGAELLGQQVDQMRQANRRVEQTIDTTIAGLIASCRELLHREQDQLESYQEKTSTFDRALAETDRETLLAGMAHQLLGMVHELRRENKAIREEVTAAKDRTIELMTRAHAAEQTARLDPLTQLPNRREFDEIQASCHEALVRKGQPYSLILIDIDHFKSVNDRYGHVAGDAVLSMIGRVLAECRRTSDNVCRLGGEEFAVVLPRCGANSARIAAERYRTRIAAASLRYRDDELSVTVSCGVAQAGLGESASNLLERADAALYAAKMQGRNRTCIDRVSSVAAPLDARRTPV